MMQTVDAGWIDAVLVNSVSRIEWEIRILDRTAERIVDGGADLHILAEGADLAPQDVAQSDTQFRASPDNVLLRGTATNN